jgi:hypothetical protein
MDISGELQKTRISRYIIDSDDLQSKQYNFCVINFATGGTFKSLLDNVDSEHVDEKTFMKKEVEGLRGNAKK